jgi:hypothetical protein
MRGLFSWKNKKELVPAEQLRTPTLQTINSHLQELINMIMYV